MRAMTSRAARSMASRGFRRPQPVRRPGEPDCLADRGAHHRTLRNGLSARGVYAFWQLVAIDAILIGVVHVDNRRRRRHGGPDLAGFCGACAGAGIGQLAKQKELDLRIVAFDSSAAEFRVVQGGPYRLPHPPGPVQDGLRRRVRLGQGAERPARWNRGRPRSRRRWGTQGRAGDPERLLSDMALRSRATARPGSCLAPGRHRPGTGACDVDRGDREGWDA